MSTEIYLNFDTIFWTSISRKKTFIYVTSLKSRIYKAAKRRMYSSMAFLQNRLLSSSSAINLALFTLLESEELTNINLNFVLQYIHVFDLWELCTKKKFLTVFTNSPKMSYVQFSNLIEKIKHILLSFALEPEIKVRQNDLHYIIHLKSSSEILSFLKIKLLNQYRYQYCFDSISLIKFLKTYNLKSLFVRLNSSNLLQINTCKHLNESTYQKYLIELKNKVFDSKKVNYRFLLYDILISFLSHCLCLEVIYLSRSPIYLQYNLILQSSSFSIIILGSELLLMDNNYNNIAAWHKLYNLLLSIPVKKREQNSLRLPFSLHAGINYLHYCIWLEKDMRLLISPSLDSQMNLISKVKFIISKEKGNSSANLIIAINKILKQWSDYFIATKAYKIFILMDYIIYLKLRAWIFRRHPNWGRNQIKRQYFLSNKFLQNYEIDSRSQWIFYAEINNQIISLLNLRYSAKVCSTII